MDKKVYKTDYKSEFTQFYETVESQPENIAVKAETEKYNRVNDLRDSKKSKTTRNKLWENF